jgi:serine/threonine-protein kinase
VWDQHRHFQEIVDALDRSLSLVSAPDPEHSQWLEAEARGLAHRNHPAAPTTYHYWTAYQETRRGPGYLRRWIAGETIGARLARAGADDVPAVLRVARELGSALAYLHDAGTVHGAISIETAWTTPMGRLWLPRVAMGRPARRGPRWSRSGRDADALPPEWGDSWAPTTASDQWQLAALCFNALTGEAPPRNDVPADHPRAPRRAAVRRPGDGQGASP